MKTLIKNAYKTQSYIYFDIETIPSQSPLILEVLEAEVTAPKALKKPESIAKWLDENRESAAKEALLKTSLDGARGHVCTIAWAKNNGKIKSRHAKTIAGEKAVIRDFFKDIHTFNYQRLVGHNILNFDIGFLIKRAIILGVKLPIRDNFPRDPKPWDSNVHDTMTMWAGGKGWVSMDRLCGILGISGKTGFDGSMVAQAWANGEHCKIRHYCVQDIDRTREIHKRFLQAGW